MDKENEEQEQRKSSVDRVNDLINKAQDVRKNVQRVQRLQKGIQAARTGAQAAQGAASAVEGIAAGAGAVEGAAAGGVGAAGGGTLLAAIVIIILLILLAAIIIIFFADASKTVGGNLTCGDVNGNCLPAGQCQSPNVVNSNAKCDNSSGISSTCCMPPVATSSANLHFFCQYDFAWKQNTPPTCDVPTYGCGPTSLSMIVYSSGNTQWTPLQTAQALRNSAGYGCTTESDVSYFINYGLNTWAKGMGFTIGSNVASGTSSNSFNFGLAQRAIANHQYIIAGAVVNCHLCGNGPIGHTFVIIGVDAATRTVTALDPTECTYASGTPINNGIITYNVDQVSQNCQYIPGYGNQCGWLYGYPVGK